MLHWTLQLLAKSSKVRYIVKGENNYDNIHWLMNKYAVDDDIWLNVERLHSFLKEISKESEEYKTNYISGYVNQYYLDVARPGSQTNKVLIKFEIINKCFKFTFCFRIRFLTGCIQEKGSLHMFLVHSTSFPQSPFLVWWIKWHKLGS